MRPSYFKEHLDLLPTTEKHLANIQPKGNKRSSSNGSDEGVEYDKKQNKGNGQSFSGLIYR